MTWIVQRKNVCSMMTWTSLPEVIHRYTAELLTLPWFNCLLLGFWANYMSLADHKSIQRGRLGEVILNITYVAHSRHPYIESLPTLWLSKTYCVYEQMTNCDCWEYNVWVTKLSTPSEYTFTIISSTKCNGNQIYVAWWIMWNRPFLTYTFAYYHGCDTWLYWHQIFCD